MIARPESNHLLKLAGGRIVRTITPLYSIAYFLGHDGLPELCRYSSDTRRKADEGAEFVLNGIA